jgi:hypothetical protein
MSESEIQKLISIFLGLAILVSSAVFVFSDNLVNSYKSDYEASLNNSLQNNSRNSEIESAFVESTKDLLPYYTTISLNDEFLPSGNLTDDFASYVAREIVKANPNGPKTDGAGGQGITVPDIENLTTNFATTTLPKINFPDWKKEVEKNYSKINIVENSENSVSDYLTGLKNIYEKYLVKNNFESLLNNSSNYQIALESISQINNDLYKDFFNLKVPDNFLEFHKNLLGILIYQKELLQHAENIDNDPLYVYYLAEKSGAQISKYLNNIEKEIQKIKDVSHIYKNNLGSDNILEKIFVVQKAYAGLWPFPSVVFDPAAVWELVKRNVDEIRKFIKKMALEILKDKLIHRMINQIIRWVQGGGTPGFVTNWKGFLAGAISSGVGDALYQIYPRICQPFRPLIQIAFRPIGNIYDEYTKCTLGNIVNNLRNFYNDFKYGGWISYSKVLDPRNNLWGQIIITDDIVLQKAAAEKEAEKDNAVASKGFLPTTKCVKETQSVVEKEIGLSLPESPNVEIICGPATTESGIQLSENVCLITKCEEYENTTPGSLVGDVVGNTIVQGPIGRIVNAEDAKGLVQALINSGLMKLIQAGEEGLTGLFNKNRPSRSTVTDDENPCFGEIIGSPSYYKCLEDTGGSYPEIPEEPEEPTFEDIEDRYNRTYEQEPPPPPGGGAPQPPPPGEGRPSPNE